MANASMRTPPQDLEAEKALLGSIMLKPDGLGNLMDFVVPDSFYAEKHRIIFRSMLDLYSKSEPIDVLSLSSRLKEKKAIASVGGASYLTELVNGVPSASNAEYYAELVRKKKLLRSLIEASEHIAELGYKEDGDIESVIDSAEKKIFGLANFSSRQKFVSIKDTLGEAWERLDRLHKSKDEIRGVRTGFADLDTKLAGLQNSDLIILAARPSMGKTSLALDIARQAACKHNVSVGIFSLEMSTQQLVDRMLAAESRVDSWKLRTGRLSTDLEFSLIRDSLDRLAKAPIYIDDDPSNNIIRMRSVARRLKAEQGLGLIVVDYLQLMVPRANVDSLVQQVTEISRSLKGLARELDVPVLALSQLNRSVEKRGDEPRLSDLRDSGSIEQDADVVLFIHRDDKYSKEADKTNVAKIIIAKHRNGPTGAFELFFDADKVSFSSIDRNSFGGF
jgi:replicative DNA helicase